MQVPHFGPISLSALKPRILGGIVMDLSAITFDQLALAIMTTIAIREVLIVTLPDQIAGPGGWLIDTSLGDHI